MNPTTVVPPGGALPTPPPAPPDPPPAVWTAAQRQQLRDAVAQAFTKENLRIVVDRGLDWRLDRRVNLDAPIDQIVFDLVDEVERGGWNEAFVRAVFAYRPNAPALRAFCEANAKYVFTPTSRQQAMAAAVGMDALVELVRRPDTARGRAHLREVAEESAAALGVVDRMGRYKQLHDALHALNYSLSYELARSVRMFRDDPVRFRATVVEVRQLRKYCGNLDDYAEEAKRAAGFLPTAEQAPQGTWIEVLMLAAKCIREAMEPNGEPAKAETGLRILRVTLAQQPTQINKQIVDLARGLDLTAVAGRLRGVVADLPAGDPLTNRFAESLTDLAGLTPRVAALVDEHDAWQQLDNPLGMVNEVPESLLLMWPRIRQLGQALIAAHPAAGWAVELTVTTVKFETAADPTAQEFALDDFRQIATRRFRAVDAELLELSTTMRHIAAGFEAVLKVLTDGIP